MVETLIALIFCLMTFTLVCSAIAAACRQLKYETTQSESRVLCGTLTMAVEDELRYAKSIEGSDIDSITYKNSNRAGNVLTVGFKNKDGRIYVYNTEASESGSDSDLDGDGSGDSSESSESKSSDFALVPQANYTQGTKAKLELKWNTTEGLKDYQCFTGKVTVMDKDGKELASQTFAVRPINY